MNMRLPAFGLIYSVVALTVFLPAQSLNHKPPQPAITGQNPFDAFPSFSATLNGGIGRDHDRKLYRSENLMRMDFDDSYRITDLKKRTTLGINGGKCVKLAIPDAGSYPFSAYHDFNVQRSLTQQRETVDGHVCTIENVTFKPKDERPIVIQMKLWEAEDLKGFPVKIEVDTGHDRKFTVNYSNVSLTPPDPALFKSPARCTTVDPGSWKDASIVNNPGPPKVAPKPPAKSPN
jgi:hypothetical protein